MCPDYSTVTQEPTVSSVPHLQNRYAELVKLIIDPNAQDLSEDNILDSIEPPASSHTSFVPVPPRQQPSSEPPLRGESFSIVDTVEEGPLQVDFELLVKEFIPISEAGAVFGFVSQEG